MVTYPSTSSLPRMFPLLALAVFAGYLVSPSLTQQIASTSYLDFSLAEPDPQTGEVCVLQRVCLSNPAAIGNRFADPCPELEPAERMELPAFPPGCNCNDASDCGGSETARCLACVCQDCPESTATTGNGVLNPPLTFVVDTTKSVKPDKYSIFNLTQKVVERIVEIEANIPSYHLITFNDYGPNFRRNVDFRLDTADVYEFKQEITSLVFDSFDGGRDSKERLMQGLVGALENAPERSLIVVFTDNGSKDLNLRGEVLRLKEEKEITVYIVLTPIFEGFPNDPSLQVYDDVADQVFFIEDVGADFFLGSVETFEESNCI